MKTISYRVLMTVVVQTEDGEEPSEHKVKRAIHRSLGGAGVPNSGSIIEVAEVIDIDRK